jgi:hypothetical protein
VRFAISFFEFYFVQLQRGSLPSSDFLSCGNVMRRRAGTDADL